MKQLFKLWPLLLIIGCSGLSNEPEKISDNILFAASVEEQKDHFRIGKGEFCKRNGNIGTCGFVRYISGGQAKVVCKNNSADAIEEARSYKIQNDFYFSPEIKGYIFKECDGEFKMLYVDGSSYVPIMVTPSDEEKLKQSQLEWSFKLTDVQNKPTYIAKYEELQVREAQEKKLMAQKKVQEEIDAKKQREEQKEELDKRRNELKKNWGQKNYKGSVVHFSKKDALLVSGYLGMMSWYDATINCRNQDMRLPSLDEMESLSANGLCTVVTNNCGIQIWTNTSRRNDRNAQRNMMVGEGVWTWAEVNNGGLPTGPSQNFGVGVICVK